MSAHLNVLASQLKLLNKYQKDLVFLRLKFVSSNGFLYWYHFETTPQLSVDIFHFIICFQVSGGGEHMHSRTKDILRGWLSINSYTKIFKNAQKICMVANLSVINLNLLWVYFIIGVKITLACKTWRYPKGRNLLPNDDIKI